MKNQTKGKILFGISVFFLLATPSPVKAATTCEERAATQAEMNACARQSVTSARERLSAQIAALQRRYADDPESLQALNSAQEAWEAFYAAQLKLLYRNGTGSVLGLCQPLAAQAMIEDRLKQLRRWDEDSADDVCGGALMAKSEEE